MQPPRKPANEKERLGALASYRVLDTPAEPAFDDLTRLAAYILDVPIALVSLVDADRQWFKARYGLDAPETPRDVSFCGHVVVDERMLVVPDALDDARFADNPLVVGEPHVRFYAGAPLRTPDGFVLGSLCGIDHGRREPMPEQLELLRALAGQVVAQLELRRQLLAARHESEEIARESAELNRLKDEFVSTVSHELRTPLTSIYGSLRLMEAGVLGALPEEARELVEVATSNSDRLLRLIDDTLDLGKIESGKFVLRLAIIEVAALVEKASYAVRGQLDESGVALDVRIEDERSLEADEDRIVQVLVNLLSNAVKYTDEGGRISVTTQAAPSGRMRISVRDEGPGIEAEDVPRLFGKFEQLDGSDARVKGGTGLGLAISREIVREHGGEIGVDTAPGKGSTFWFELPTASPR